MTTHLTKATTIMNEYIDRSNELAKDGLITYSDCGQDDLDEYLKLSGRILSETLSQLVGVISLFEDNDYAKVKMQMVNICLFHLDNIIDAYRKGEDGLSN